MTDYRVDLDIFRGPLDLLLYLVRQNEVDICDIPISKITEQYVEYLKLLELIDLGLVGDFLVMASSLMEIKSRMLLPHAVDQGAEAEDPRSDLVRQLLEYKQFKDAASMLEERSRAWQQRYPRLADDRPVRGANPAEEVVKEVELWDLVNAFGRLLRDAIATAPSNIVYDDTPVHVYMEQIESRLMVCGRLRFRELFDEDLNRSRIVGIFLALLELIKSRRVRAEQDNPFDEIWMTAVEPIDPGDEQVASRETHQPVPDGPPPNE
jgi:segregation and condensation protein A